jgi:hypothetical protein
MDSPPPWANKALLSQHPKSKESNQNQLQQPLVNLVIPHLLPKSFENRNLKSRESHPRRLQQLRENLVTPYLPLYLLPPQERVH